MNGGTLMIAPLRNAGLLSAESERELGRRALGGDAAARDRLVESNLRLVAKIARSFQGRGMAMDDLIGEGNLGLIRAAERFDPAFGARFSTYASYWISESIRRALTDTGTTIRLPAHLAALLNRWRHAEGEIRRATGRAPAVEAVAKRLGLSDVQVEMVARAKQALRLRPGALDPEWTLCGDGSRPEANAEADDDRDDLRKRLGRLDDLELAVITLRFGLSDGEPLSLLEVGKRLGVTREWARKVEHRAVKKLRVGRAGDAVGRYRRRVAGGPAMARPARPA